MRDKDIYKILKVIKIHCNSDNNKNILSHIAEFDIYDISKKLKCDYKSLLTRLLFINTLYRDKTEIDLFRLKDKSIPADDTVNMCVDKQLLDDIYNELKEKIWEKKFKFWVPVGISILALVISYCVYKAGNKNKSNLEKRIDKIEAIQANK